MIRLIRTECAPIGPVYNYSDRKCWSPGLTSVISAAPPPRRESVSCLGVHFALTEQEVSLLREQPDGESRVNFVKEVFEEAYLGEESPYAAESVKTWDAMDRAMTMKLDDSLDPEGALRHLVVDGERLNSGDDYILSLKTPDQVALLARIVEKIDISAFRDRYFMIDPAEYGEPLTEEDFQYTWEWFQCVRDLFRTAASSRRYVLFTVDQ